MTCLLLPNTFFNQLPFSTPIWFSHRPREPVAFLLTNVLSPTSSAFPSQTCQMTQPNIIAAGARQSVISTSFLSTSFSPASFS